MACFPGRPGFLSLSTDGRPIGIVATATPGTPIHIAATPTAKDFDQIWLYAVNISASTVALTLEIGGVGVADQVIVGIPGQSGLLLVLEGQLLNDGVTVAAFAATGNVINVLGYVNQVYL